MTDGDSTPDATDVDASHAVDAAAAGVVYRARLPRAGELSPGWRVGTALTWVAVIVALAAVWNASVQLGLSTWWLGARAQPEPLPVRLVPFAAPALMVLGAINQVRWLGWLGVVAGGVVIGVGVADLGRVTSIGVTEILIGVAGAAVALASLTGTYRRDPAATADTATTPSPAAPPT